MANRTEELKLIISGDGRLLGTELKNTENGVRQSTRRMEGDFARLGKSIGSKAFNMIKSPVTGLVGGTALLYAGKQIIDYDAQLTRMAIQADISSEAQMRLRKQIDDVAFAANQSRTEILAGVNKIVEQSGDLQFAKDIMLDMAYASTATGAGMEYLGALAVQLRDKLKMGKDEIKASLNLLNVQGKAGAFTLENMATMGERLFAAAGRFDMKGVKDLGRFGAFLQIARMGTGSSEQATTAVENVLADILDKQKEIKKAGFNIFGPDNKLKSFEDIIKGIVNATGGNEIKLGNIFGRESIRAISVLAKAYRETKGFDLFDQLTNADAGKTNQIMADFARYSTSAAYQLQMLSIVATDFADTAISPILSDLTKSLRDLTSDPKRLEEFRTKIRGIGEEVGKAASNIYKIADSISKLVPYIDMLSAWAKWTFLPVKVGKGAVDVTKQGIGKGVDFIGGIFKRDESTKDTVNNTINLKVNIDNAGRVTSVSDGINTTLNTDVNRGAIDGVQ